MSDDRTPGTAPPGGPGPVDGADDGGAARLVLADGTGRRLARGLEDAYPREGCGLLLGRVEGADRVVEEARPAPNRWEARDDRYLVDPETLRRAVDEEAAGGPRVLGFYHSHPDAEPVPSSTDRELAWPWYLYLVVPVRDGRAGRGRAWELEEDGDGWVERAVVAGREAGPGDGERTARGADRPRRRGGGPDGSARGPANADPPEA